MSEAIALQRPHHTDTSDPETGLQLSVALAAARVKWNKAYSVTRRRPAPPAAWKAFLDAANRVRDLERRLLASYQSRAR
jgi:hypothetical protein